MEGKGGLERAEAPGPREKGSGRLRGEDSRGCLWAVTGQTRCQREQRRGAETGEERSESRTGGGRGKKGRIMGPLTGDVQSSNGITRSVDSQRLTRIKQSLQRRVYGSK